MASFLVLYRGETISAAKMVALSADPALVGDVAGRLLTDPEEPGQDATLAELEQGRRRALRLIQSEADE